MFPGGSVQWLVVGLGNTGPEYDRTRHNVGFRAADLLAKQTGVKIDRLRFRALTAQAVIGGQKVLLMKPQTFMNASGMAVEPAAAFYKIPPERILILSDDISLPVGRIRVRSGGSAGGHNGLKSVISAVGSQDFPRVRIGVGEKPHPDYDLADWVLGRFSAQEETALAPAVEHAAAAVEMLLQEGWEKAAARFNGL